MAEKQKKGLSQELIQTVCDEVLSELSEKDKQLIKELMFMREHNFKAEESRISYQREGIDIARQALYGVESRLKSKY